MNREQILLRQQRSDYEKAIRKDYEEHKVKAAFGQIKEYSIAASRGRDPNDPSRRTRGGRSNRDWDLIRYAIH